MSRKEDTSTVRRATPEIILRLFGLFTGRCTRAPVSTCSLIAKTPQLMGDDCQEVVFVDTTADTTQRATRRNVGQPLARKLA